MDFNKCGRRLKICGTMHCHSLVTHLKMCLTIFYNQVKMVGEHYIPNGMLVKCYFSVSTELPSRRPKLISSSSSVDSSSADFEGMP